MLSFKEKVKQFYTETLLHKIDALRQQQEDLKDSLRDETKSTAGDKYETSRAMLHIEQENIAAQLSVLLQQRAVLDNINATQYLHSTNIKCGSLVKTNNGFVFVGIALG